MSVLSSFMSPTIKSTEDPASKAARDKLMATAMPGAISAVQNAGQAYTGKLVADVSPIEQQGLDTLSQWLKSPKTSDSSLWKSAEGELSKTLSGNTYDPVAGTYYQGLRAAVMRELQNATNSLASKISARDAYFGGGRVASQGLLEEGAQNQLTQTLGQLSLQERQNRLAAVPQAQAMATAAGNEDLTRVAAAEQYGSLPRTIEQAKLDADYQEQLRQWAALGLDLDVVTGMATYQPPKTVQPSALSQVAQGVAAGAKLAATM